MKAKLGNDYFNLIGKTIKVGDEAIDATLVNAELQDVDLKQYFNRVVVISTFPSIDTPTCDNQTRTLMKKYDENPNIVLVNISEDLPFAQVRGCAAEGVKNPIILSDYQKHDFGIKYGLLIEGINLLARSVMIIKNKKIVYLDLIEDQDDSINFDKLYEEIEKNL